MHQLQPLYNGLFKLFFKASPNIDYSSHIDIIWRTLMPNVKLFWGTWMGRRPALCLAVSVLCHFSNWAMSTFGHLNFQQYAQKRKVAQKHFGNIRSWNLSKHILTFSKCIWCDDKQTNPIFRNPVILVVKLIERKWIIDYFMTLRFDSCWNIDDMMKWNK